MTKGKYALMVAEAVGGRVQYSDRPNGITLTGIAVDMGGGFGKIFYIDDMYEDGLTVEQAAMYIKSDKTPLPFDAVNVLYDWEQAKRLILPRLYNQATKADVWTSAAEYGFNDLIIVPYIEINDKMASKVTNRHLEHWGVTADEVMRVAIENATPDKYQLRRLTAVTGEKGNPDIFIVNRLGDAYGAYAAVGLKDTLRGMFPGGYLAIPSSIHEFLIVSADWMDDRAAKNMVDDMNHSIMMPEEILSDHAYRF